MSCKKYICDDKKNKEKLCYRIVFLRIFVSVYIFVMLVGFPYFKFWGVIGPLKVIFMALACVLLITDGLFPSKALGVGIIYWIWQLFVASMHMETWRWSTLLFSSGFIFSYICIYNLIYFRQIFSIDTFLNFVKLFMMIFFIWFIMQQICIIGGIHYAPVINLHKILDRGWGAPSLAVEPSTFARYMLICYYTYLKVSEYKYKRGPFSLKELFSGEHRWITIRFLWMMCTMGSGTAYGCLIMLACYFITKKNCIYLLPIFLFVYIGIQFIPQIEQMERATQLINATIMTRNVQVMKKVEGSGSSRIAPLINSFDADFSKFETWFGHGVDYVKNKNGWINQTCTMFDDYGLILWIIGMFFNFCCAYRFKSLGAIFCILGVGGGAGNNIIYAWPLMMLMTCERYFYEQTFPKTIHMRLY